MRAVVQKLSHRWRQQSCPPSPLSFLLAVRGSDCYWLSKGAVLDVCTVKTPIHCLVHRLLAPCEVRISACDEKCGVLLVVYMSDELLSCATFVLLVKRIKPKCCCVERRKIICISIYFIYRILKNTHMLQVMAN